MALEKKVSFNQAWKDFLLVRPVTTSSQIMIHRNPEKVVDNVGVGDFKIITKGSEQFMIDDASCSGIILAYPRQKVEDEIREKILVRLIGKPLSDEKMESIKNKLDWDAKKMASRLGCSNSKEIQRALANKSFWEVLFSLHQLIEHRLRKIILYKSSAVNSTASEITICSSMEKICEGIKTHRHLVEIGYLLSALSPEEKTKALSFNADRDNIAHKLLTNEITDDLLEKASDHGIEVLNGLEQAFQRIVPKPEMIMMDSFLIREFLD